jgi:hypothetical protein
MAVVKVFSGRDIKIAYRTHSVGYFVPEKRGTLKNYFFSAGAAGAAGAASGALTEDVGA